MPSRRDLTRLAAADDTAAATAAADAVRAALRPPRLTWPTWQPGRAVVTHATRTAHGIRVTLRPAAGGGTAVFTVQGSDDPWHDEAMERLQGLPVRQPDPALLAADRAEHDAILQRWEDGCPPTPWTRCCPSSPSGSRDRPGPARAAAKAAPGPAWHRPDPIRERRPNREPYEAVGARRRLALLAIGYRDARPHDG